MTGIVGFFADDGQDVARQRLARMVEAVTDHETYRSECFYDAPAAIARVHLGILDSTPQPLWDESRTHCIFFEGELFEKERLKSSLLAVGQPLRYGNSAELALYWFLEHGDAGLAQLNGAFMFAVWNVRTRELILANDRLGQRHLYYAVLGDHIAFACGVRGLLADERVPRTTDLVAFAQVLSFEHLLGERTYLTAVKLLPPATVMRIREGVVTTSTYWRLTFAETFPFLKRQDYFDGMLSALRQSVARQLSNDVAAGINLSGGLDSRMLLGLAAEQVDPQRLRSYTFGVPGCDDIRIAAELAEVAGIEHTWYPLPADYLLELADVAVRITDGMDSLIHVHTLATLPEQAREVDTIYTGYYVDCLADSDGTRETMVHFDDEVALNHLYVYMHRLFPREPAETIFTPEFCAATKDEYQTSFRENLLISKCHLASNWMEHVELYHRQRRLTQFGNDLLRWRVECRTPFCDNDLVDFCLALPPGMRVERYLFTETLKTAFRKLAKVPHDRTGVPLVDDARYYQKTLQQRLRWYLYNKGLAAAPRYDRRPYSRYDLWFRSELRPFVEATLLSPDSLQRGIFQPEVLRRIVADHMAERANYMREIGMMMSIELWHRKYLAAPAPDPQPALMHAM